MSFFDTDNKFIRYLKKPLLGVSALTAYNLPNSLVHIPILVMIVYIGVYICGEALKPLLTVYFAVALYTARDMMAISYMNKVIPAVIWAIFVPFIVFKKEVAEYLTFSQQDSITITLILLAVFLIYVPVYMKKVLKW